MTGIYGAGRAFNLKYRPNGPMKVFVTDRRPIFNFFGGCRGAHYGGGYDMMSSSTYIEYKPNFWDNLSSIIQSATGAFCMLGSMGVFNKKSDGAEGAEGKPKPQGATSDNNDAADDLKKLNTLAKGKGISIIERNGKFTLMKDDKVLKDADFNEAVDWISTLNSNKSVVEKPTAAPVEEPTSKPTEAPVDDIDYITPRPSKVALYNGKIDVIDVGEPSDIINKPTIIGEEKTTNGYPKKITINGGDYIFDENKSKNGEVWYKSQFGKYQSYRLEELNEKIVLIQHEGDSGYNIANTK